MAVSELISDDLNHRVMEAVKAAEARGAPPLIQAAEAARCARESGSSFPNLDLGLALVSNLCFDHNIPSLWKLLHQAMASRAVSSFHTLALLTARVITKRREEPEAYRLYLELLSRYLFSDDAIEPGAYRDMITKSVDGALELSRTYGIREIDFGHALIFFLLHVILGLFDGILEDWDLQFGSFDKQSSRYDGEVHQVMDIDAKNYSGDARHEHRAILLKANSLMTFEALEKITANKKAKVFLRLIKFNMPENFDDLMHRLRLIETHNLTSQGLGFVRHIWVKLFANVQNVYAGEHKLNTHHLPGILLNNAWTSGPTSCYYTGPDRAACWISLDIYMENAMDGKNLQPLSAIEVLTELTKTLQVVNHASWQETFQALWISALRLVQRDHQPWEGPIPCLEARLCMLLSIVPLAIVALVKEENDTTTYSSTTSHHCMEQNTFFSRRRGLIFSLQVLGQFSGLLLPPSLVVKAANDAASKAAAYISKFSTGGGSLSTVCDNNTFVRAGNMLHLIVEACIARNLIDTSAYFWPGYVSSAPSKNSTLVQESPWSVFMEGAQVTDSLKNSLIETPASSTMELEKLYHIALNGCEEERSAAAKILCGASLIRGWNIQEHVVHMVMKLLSPPVLAGFPGNSTGSHLTGCLSLLSALLFGIHTDDALHILSLYGMVPELAAALLPLCEAFGSISPLSNHNSSSSDEKSIYEVFSCAFLFLLRLWKFYKPRQEHCIAGRGSPVRLELTLDYLLLTRNRCIQLQTSSSKDRQDNSSASTGPPIYIDSFPRLRSWYLQNQACIASILSGLCSEISVHQVANNILNMICWKMKKMGNNSGIPSACSSGSISGSPVNTEEDSYQKPMLPAWEVLEAMPYVLEAVLSAFAHGRISSRDLTKALRDLVDFLPASFATITSYFSAEITRGIWRPVSMNGIDWPSPAANLLSVESEVKEILASVGVHVPSCYASGMAPMLPLPMAALLSLTITFKVEKSLHYMNAMVGRALENCATGCPWSSRPIIAALWTQKVCNWRDYIIFDCTCSPFARDKGTIPQLIRSCFAAFLGLSVSNRLSSHCNVSALLGDAITSKGCRLPMEPGFLYLRTCRTFQDTRFVSNILVCLVIEWAQKLAAGCNSSGPTHLKSGRTSLPAVVAGVRDAASLGASLLCITGGLRLVQVLYEETVPEVFILAREEEVGRGGGLVPVLTGYSLAYMMILCGAFVWGVGEKSLAFTSVYPSRLQLAFVMHMEFVAKVMEGNVMLRSEPAVWKSYALCFLHLLVQLVPAWLSKVSKETLLKLANGLRRWDECELAIQLLERGGPSSVTAVVEYVL